jgi:nucleotide-binding universal stress UspA family protein
LLRHEPRRFFNPAASVKLLISATGASSQKGEKEAAMKNVLVPIHDDPGQESRLQAALDLTRALDGHLTCLATITPPQALPEVYMAVGYDQLVAAERADADSNRARVEARLALEDVRWNCIEVIAHPAAAIQQAIGLADIVVLNRMLDRFALPDWLKVTSETIIASRKPVVAVPEEARGFVTSGHALIAWDGSVEAAAALRAAVPLLQKAANVALLEIDDGHIEKQGEEAAAYLSRHGVHARLVREPRGRSDPAQLILDRAVASTAGYIVMGGFGRGRLREALFGGVTRTLLRSSPVPVVLVH